MGKTGAPVKSKLTLFITILVIATLIIVSYCYKSGKDEYEVASQALKLNDLDSAVTHFSRSINWYVPYASYVVYSADNLINIAALYEEAGGYEKAKYTYNILRGALLSVRSAYQPMGEYITICTERITALSTGNITGSDTSGRSKEKGKLSALLNDIHEADTFWSYLSSFSFIAWVLVTIALIMKLFKNNVVNLNKGVIILAVSLAVSYVLWLVSLIKA